MTLDGAIQAFSRKVEREGIFRELKMREFPKPGERKRFKEFIAKRRRLKKQGRRLERGGER